MADATTLEELNRVYHEASRTIDSSPDLTKIYNDMREGFGAERVAPEAAPEVVPEQPLEVEEGQEAAPEPETVVEEEEAAPEPGPSAEEETASLEPSEAEVDAALSRHGVSLRADNSRRAVYDLDAATNAEELEEARQKWASVINRINGVRQVYHNKLTSVGRGTAAVAEPEAAPKASEKDIEATLKKYKLTSVRANETRQAIHSLDQATSLEGLDKALRDAGRAAGAPAVQKVYKAKEKKLAAEEEARQRAEKEAEDGTTPPKPAAKPRPQTGKLDLEEPPPPPPPLPAAAPSPQVNVEEALGAATTIEELKEAFHTLPFSVQSDAEARRIYDRRLDEFKAAEKESPRKERKSAAWTAGRNVAAKERRAGQTRVERRAKRKSKSYGTNANEFMRGYNEYWDSVEGPREVEEPEKPKAKAREKVKEPTQKEIDKVAKEYVGTDDKGNMNPIWSAKPQGRRKGEQDPEFTKAVKRAIYDLHNSESIEDMQSIWNELSYQVQSYEAAHDALQAAHARHVKGSEVQEIKDGERKGEDLTDPLSNRPTKLSKNEAMDAVAEYYGAQDESLDVKLALYEIYTARTSKGMLSAVEKLAISEKLRTNKVFQDALRARMKELNPQLLSSAEKKQATAAMERILTEKSFGTFQEQVEAARDKDVKVSLRALRMVFPGGKVKLHENGTAEVSDPATGRSVFVVPVSPEVIANEELMSRILGPEGVLQIRDGSVVVRGAFFEGLGGHAADVIFLSKAVDPKVETLRHEAFHWAYRNMLTNEDRRILSKQYGKRDQNGEYVRDERGYIVLDEESAAHYYATNPRVTGPVSRLFNRMTKFFGHETAWGIMRNLDLSMGKIPKTADTLQYEPVPDEVLEQFRSGGPITYWPGIFELVHRDGAETFRDNLRMAHGPAIETEMPDDVELGPSDPSVNRRWDEATDVEPDKRRDNIFKRMHKAWRRGFRQTYKNIDSKNSVEEGAIQDIIRLLHNVPGFAESKAARIVNNVTRGLDNQGQLIMARYLALRDILRDIVAEDGPRYSSPQEVPFGWSHPDFGDLHNPNADITAELAKYEKVLDRNPHIREAVNRRNRAIKQIVDDLHARDLLDDEISRKPEDYYHRMVIEQLKSRLQHTGRGVLGPGALSAKEKRFPYQIERIDKGKDFLLQYAQAEYEWLSQAIYSIAQHDLMARVKQISDRRPELSRKAKEHNEIAFYGFETFQKLRGLKAELSDQVALGEEGDKERIKEIRDEIRRLDPLYEYRRAIAVGWDTVTQRLKALDVRGQIPTAFGQVYADLVSGRSQTNALHTSLINEQYRFLQWLSEANATRGDEKLQVAIGSIFKAIQGRKDALKRGLREKGYDFKTWREMITNGLTPWAPKDSFFVTPVLLNADKIVDEMAEKMVSSGELDRTLDKSDLTAEMKRDIRSAMVMARAVMKANNEWVIPDNIASALDAIDQEYGRPQFAEIDGFISKAMTAWKMWILLNPLRALRYNLNNMTGDLDITLAGLPSAILEIPRAVKYLRQYHYRYKPSSSDVRKGKQRPEMPGGLKKKIDEWMALGVISSGWSHQEIPAQSKFGQLSHKRGPLQVAFAGRYGTQNFTEFRENILRVAAYERIRKLQEKAKADPKTKKKVDNMYLASFKREIDAMRKHGASDKEVAAKLSRELVGDYGAISYGGRYLRQRFLPFYSWMEINAPRYMRLMQNTGFTGRTGAIGAGFVAGRAAQLFTSVFYYYTMISLWNYAVAALDGDDPWEKINESIAIMKKEGMMPAFWPKRLTPKAMRDDGVFYYTRVEGAFADFLEWFGLQGLPLHAVSYVRDKIRKRRGEDLTEEEAAGLKERILGEHTAFEQMQMATDAFANKLTGGISPYFKLIYEMPSQQRFVWDLFGTAPRYGPYRSQTEPLLSMLGINRQLKDIAPGAVTDLTLKDVAKAEGVKDFGAKAGMLAARWLLLYRRDPAQAAVYEDRDNYYEFLLERGETDKERRSIIYTPTTKDNAVYDVRQALRYDRPNDEVREKLEEYYRVGGNEKHYLEHIASPDPLKDLRVRGNTKENREDYEAWLNETDEKGNYKHPEERKIHEAAMRYTKSWEKRARDPALRVELFDENMASLRSYPEIIKQYLDGEAWPYDSHPRGYRALYDYLKEMGMDVPDKYSTFKRRANKIARERRKGTQQ